MKKIVFKGIINGKEFDNVKDYNEAMSKLIDQGATNINASSETRIVDEPEEAVEKVSLGGFDVNNYLPLFNDIDEYYLDKLVSDDVDLNRKNYEDVNNTLNQSIENLCTLLDNDDVSLGDVLNLFNKVKEIKAQIKQDLENNEDAIRNLKTEISDLQTNIERDMEKLHTLNSAKSFIDLTRDYYNYAFKLIKDFLLSF